MCRDGQYFTGGDYPEYDCDEAEQAGCSNGATVVCEHSLPGECALDYRTPHSKHEQVEGRALSRNFSKFPERAGPLRIVRDLRAACARTTDSAQWRVAVRRFGHWPFELCWKRCIAMRCGNDVLRCAVACPWRLRGLPPAPAAWFSPEAERAIRNPHQRAEPTCRGRVLEILTRFKSSLKIRNRTEHRRRTTTRFRVLDSYIVGVIWGSDPDTP